MKLPIEIIPNALTDRENQDLLQYFEENKNSEDEFRLNWAFEPLTALGRHINEPDSKYRDINLLDPRIVPLKRILKTCEDYFRENYKLQKEFKYKRGFLNEMGEGTSLSLHSDDNDIYAGKREGEVHYSAIYFMNDDYQGGELIFNNYEEDEARYYKVKPAKGDLVLFKGSTHHGVDEILQGSRKNYVIFFRDFDPDAPVIIDDEKRKEMHEGSIEEYKERGESHLIKEEYRD